MTDEQLYTIGELADLADVTPRTIRYYTAEGLLPAPDTRGRYALYNRDHLNRLQLITRLKDAFLPLNEIKARLDQLSPEQVGQLLAEYTSQQEAAPLNSAADYLSQVLSSGTAPPSKRESLAHGLAEPVPPAKAQMQLPPQASSSLPASRLPDLQQPRYSKPQLSTKQSRPAADEERIDGNSWQRVNITPDIELHIREPVKPESADRIQRLIAFTRNLFHNDPDPR